MLALKWCYSLSHCKQEALQLDIKSCSTTKQKTVQETSPAGPSQKALLEFIQNHCDWVDEQNTMIFSDEKKKLKYMDGPNSSEYYTHDMRHEEQALRYLHSQVRSVLVWVEISNVQVEQKCGQTFQKEDRLTKRLAPEKRQ